MTQVNASLTPAPQERKRHAMKGSDAREDFVMILPSKMRREMVRNAKATRGAWYSVRLPCMRETCVVRGRPGEAKRSSFDQARNLGKCRPHEVDVAKYWR